MAVTLAQPDFRGSIPAKYDEHLGPVLFRPYAIDLAKRIPPLPSRNAKVLEIACGTGRLTRILRDALPPNVGLVATDLSDSMLTHAQELHSGIRGVEWRQADMADLDCDDGCFDAVFCQFGTMFCEDKSVVFSEAFRVLNHGGRFIFNVWDSLEFNDLARIADKTLRSLFPDNPPRFLETPFGFNDHKEIRTTLHHAGFPTVEIETVHKPCIAQSAHSVAVGFIEGSPNIVALNNLGVTDPEPVVERLAKEIAAHYGDNPVRCRMQAIVCTAHKK